MAENREKKTAIDGQTLNRIKNEIEKIQYGSVTIVIHDGKIVQLESSSKTRL